MIFYLSIDTHKLTRVDNIVSLHLKKIRKPRCDQCKSRDCSASLVLDTRTNRKNASEYPLAIRFTVDRKFFYHPVGGSYSEKRFSDICNATKSSSNNYKEQKMWREEIVPKYKDMLVNLNKGNSLTYEMVRVTITTGNTNTEIAKKDKSIIGIWREYIYHLQHDDNGKR